MEKYLNKKIYACEDLGCRYSYIGKITSINESTTEIHNEKNPASYQQYTIKTTDFLNWLQQKYYKLK